MRSEKYARLKSGIQAGLIASVILGFVIWLFGYITGERLAIALLFTIAAGVGVICGAQVYVSGGDKADVRDEVLAELEELSADKAQGKTVTVVANKQRNSSKTA
jgi:hypothetical protein